MYWNEILWLLSWPLFIWVNYLIISYVLKKYEKKYTEIQNSDKTVA
jgi:hypothetical protein